MMIRPGSPSDASTAARLHVDSITDGFLSRLGPRFLSRLYRRIARDDRSFLLIAEDSNDVVGMIAGAENVSDLYRRFAVRDGVGAAVVAAPQLARNLRSVIETWRYGGSGEDLPSAELLSVAVADRARGRGIGRALVAALIDEFERRGKHDVKVVVGAGNDPALALYAGSGFHEVQMIEVHHDVPSKVLVCSRPR